MSFRGDHELVDQSVRAYGAFFSGAFVVLALLRVRSLLTRALVGAAVAAAAVAGWYLKLHLRFVDFRSAVSSHTWDAYRVGFPDLPATPPPPGTEFVGSASVSEFARSLADGLATASLVTPGFMTLVLLVGAWLAWGWYYQISRNPIGPAPKPFVEFRFNDHLIWVLIVLVVAGQLGQASWLSVFTANLLIVMGGLYAARGLAVAQTGLRRLSPLFAMVLYLLSFPILPLALFAIGVADTWLDLRRRMAPPQGAAP